MKPMMTILSIALLTGLAVLPLRGNVNAQQPPAKVPEPPAVDVPGGVQNANAVPELSITYHLQFIDAQAFSRMLEDLFSARGIQVKTTVSENAVRVVTSPGNQKTVIDILSTLEPSKPKLDAFR